MVRLRIWTLLVVVAQLAVVWCAWNDRATALALGAALDRAMTEQTEEALGALRALAEGTDAAITPVLLVAVISTVVVMGWLHSAAVLVYRNRLGELRHAPGWAIGAWFVPILNLVRPPAIAADVFRAARADPPAGLVVGLWWLLWLGHIVTWQLASVKAEAARTPDDYADVFGQISTSDLVWIGAAAMTVALVVLTTTGLGSVRSLTRGTGHELREPVASGYPSNFWGTPVEPVADAVPAADSRFGPAPVPEARFGVPSYDASVGPRATPVGPPEPWLAAPAPTAVAPAPAPGSWTPEPQATAAPVVPVVPVAPPAPAPVAAPATPAPSAPEPGSPYPSGGVFYPQ